MKNETILNEIISEGQVNEVASLNLAEMIFSMKVCLTKTIYKIVLMV